MSIRVFFLHKDLKLIFSSFSGVEQLQVLLWLYERITAEEQTRKNEIHEEVPISHKQICSLRTRNKKYRMKTTLTFLAATGSLMIQRIFAPL